MSHEVLEQRRFERGRFTMKVVNVRPGQPQQISLVRDNELACAMAIEEVRHLHSVAWDMLNFIENGE